MARAGRILTGLAALMLGTGAAGAADLPVVVAVAPPAPPPTFDWGGAYVGVHLGLWDEFDCEIRECDALEPGVQAGYNFVNGNILYGVEGTIGVWWTPWNGGASPLFFTLSGRGGFLVGDKLLVYAELGIWGYFINGPSALIAGGGVEYALTNALSVFGEAKVFRPFGGPLGTGIWLQAGVNWHIGN